MTAAPVEQPRHPDASLARGLLRWHFQIAHALLDHAIDRLPLEVVNRCPAGSGVSAGVRYGLTNAVELTLGGVYDLPAHVTHAGASIPTVDNGTFTGTLGYELSRFGVLGGVRYVTGLVVRLTVGAELGWSHRSYSIPQLRDPTRAGAPDYGLGLPDLAVDDLVVQPGVGVEWAFADHWSASLLLRTTLLLGPEPVVGLSGGLTLSYGWFP